MPLIVAAVFERLSKKQSSREKQPHEAVARSK